MRCLLVMSRILYRVEILDLSTSQERRRRTAVGCCIWKKNSKSEVTSFLNFNGKRARRRPSARSACQKVNCFEKAYSHGAVATSRHMQSVGSEDLEGVGWLRTCSCLLRALTFPPVIEDDGFFDYGTYFPDAGDLKNVTTFEAGTWAHFTRELVRKAVWKQIDKERQREGRPMWGIANGINTEETMKIYRKVDARTQGVY